MSRHSWTVACLSCWRAVTRLAGVSYLTSRSPASLHICCHSPRMSLMGTGWGRVFLLVNTALSERTALVISLLTVTIELNCFCLLCLVHLCVQSRIDLPCNLVLNTTKRSNILIIFLFFILGVSWKSRKSWCTRTIRKAGNVLLFRHVVISLFVWFSCCCKCRIIWG